MQILIRSNDPVEIGFVQALLADSDIDCIVLDQHSAAVDGSIGAVPRRLCVLDSDLSAARALLTEAGLLPAG